MRQRLFILILILIAFQRPTQAQTLEPTTSTAQIDGMARTGASLLLILDKKVVEKAWQRQLKLWGKPESAKTHVTIPKAELPQVGPCRIWTTIQPSTTGTTIFLAAAADSTPIQPGHPQWSNLQRQLSDFARNLYREDLTRQIEEADKTVEQATKVHDKTVGAGDNLQHQLKRAQDEQERLTKQLEENRKAQEKLRQDLQQNKTDQETALDEIKRVRSLAEEKRARLSRAQ